MIQDSTRRSPITTARTASCIAYPAAAGSRATATGNVPVLRLRGGASGSSANNAPATSAPAGETQGEAATASFGRAAESFGFIVKSLIDGLMYGRDPYGLGESLEGFHRAFAGPPSLGEQVLSRVVFTSIALVKAPIAAIDGIIELTKGMLHGIVHLLTGK